MSLNWLFLDLNSFFASVEQAENPDLRGKPVAVVPTVAETTSCIAASYEAKAYGVKTGTSVRDARRMCPDIIFIVGDHRQYVAYHHRIIATVDKHLPITKVLSIDEMACQLIGREKEENYCRAKALEIKQAIYRDISPALSCSIGIAPNKFLAKVASDMQKPNGLVVIHQSDIPQAFFKLVPRDFPGIGAQMEKRLFEKRCLTVKQLYQLSQEQMRAIWGGICGENFWHLLRGNEIEEKATKRGSIGHSQVLAPKFRNEKDAFAICMRLLSKACMRMREEGFVCKEIHLSLKFISSSEENRRWYGVERFFETDDTLEIGKALEKIWLSAAKRKFLKVGIVLSGLVPRQRHQLSLFEKQNSASLMKALDCINRKYKKNLVYLGSSQSAKDAALVRIAFQRIPKEHE